MRLALLKQVQEGHEDGIWAAAWAPSTSSRPPILLTGSVDETVKLWKGDELDLIQTNTGHSLGVVSVSADPTSTMAASSSLDSVIRVFDTENNSTIANLECGPAEAWSLAFHPQGKQLAVAGGGSGKVQLWNVSDWKSSDSLTTPADAELADADAGSKKASLSSSSSSRYLLCVAWSPDGKRIAASFMDGTVSVFDAVYGKFLHNLDGHHMPVRSLAFSPIDSRILFTASDDSHIHMYDCEEKELISAMSGHASWVLSLSVNNDGTAMASGSSDRTVRLWDLSMRTSVQVLKDHQDQVWAVSFCPYPQSTKSGRLVSASDDKSVILYDYS